MGQRGSCGSIGTYRCLNWGSTPRLPKLENPFQWVPIIGSIACIYMVDDSWKHSDS